MGRSRLFALLALAGLIVAGPTDTLPAEESAQPFQEWQILEAKTGHPIGFEDMLADIASADVIYIGEEHSHQIGRAHV